MPEDLLVIYEKDWRNPTRGSWRIEAAYDRMVRKCGTEEEYRWEMVSGHYLSTYSPDVADYVRI